MPGMLVVTGSAALRLYVGTARVAHRAHDGVHTGACLANGCLHKRLSSAAWLPARLDHRPLHRQDSTAALARPTAQREGWTSKGASVGARAGDDPDTSRVAYIRIRGVQHHLAESRLRPAQFQNNLALFNPVVVTAVE